MNSLFALMANVYGPGYLSEEERPTITIHYRRSLRGKRRFNHPRYPRSRYMPHVGKKEQAKAARKLGASFVDDMLSLVGTMANRAEMAMAMKQLSKSKGKGAV